MVFSPLKNPPIGVAPPPRGCGDDPLLTILEFIPPSGRTSRRCAALIYLMARASSKCPGSQKPRKDPPQRNPRGSAREPS